MNLKHIALTALFAATAGFGFSANAAQQIELKYGSLDKQDATFKYDSRSNRLMIWIHGGGWAAGDKLDETSRVAMQEALDNGYAVLSANYRLVPRGRFTAQHYDIQAAVLSALQGRCAEGGLRVCNIEGWRKVQSYARRGYVIMGGSAGGNLAVTAAGTLIAWGQQGPLKCVGNVAGPIDFNNLSAVNPTALGWIKDFAYPNPPQNIDIESLRKRGLWSSGRGMTWITGYSGKDPIVPPSLIEPGLPYLQGPGNDVDSIKADGLGHDNPNGNEVVLHSVRYVAQKCNMKR